MPQILTNEKLVEILLIRYLTITTAAMTQETVFILKENLLCLCTGKGFSVMRLIFSHETSYHMI